MRQIWDKTKTQVSAGLRERLHLARRTLSAQWVATSLMLVLTSIHLLLVAIVPRLEVFWAFPLISVVLCRLCWLDFRQLRGRFGGRGFFGVLRNAAAYQDHVARLRAEVRDNREAAARRRDEAPLASKASVRARLAQSALDVISRQTGEPRARKVAQKAIKTGDAERMLHLIADNHRDEPRSADTAKKALGAIARV